MLPLPSFRSCAVAYLFCLVGVGCQTRSSAEYERLYTRARAAAAQQPPAPLWGGLRLGMDSAHVARHLDSLGHRQALAWVLPRGPLPVTPAAHYRGGRLRDFTLRVPGYGQPWSPRHEALQAGLDTAYGPNYPHNGTSSRHQMSWFNHGTEIELTATWGTGFSITYRQAVP